MPSDDKNNRDMLSNKMPPQLPAENFLKNQITQGERS